MRLLAVLLLLLTGIAPAAADAPPSKGAKTMPGAMGTFSFQPKDWKKGQTSYWSDTDGVDPGKAGCHIGTNDKGVPNGRHFGEACLSQTILVEANPGANVVHSHKDDTGHPDKFDCNACCVGKGKKSGVCVAAPAPPCADSAKCQCE